MIKINAAGPMPIYEQIVEGFKEHILAGRLMPGDAIPSVRRLAVEVGVNPNTVGKAYLEMERLGMIETRRGKGAYVLEPADLRRSEAQAFREELKKLLTKMRATGLGTPEISEMIVSVFEELK